MPLRCPNCDTIVPAANVNMEQTLAICPNCDHAFNFADQVPPRREKPSERERERERKVKQPQQVKILESDDGVKLRYDDLPSNGIIRAVMLFSRLIFPLLGLAWIALSVLISSKLSLAVMGLLFLFGLPVFLIGILSVDRLSYIELDRQFLRLYHFPFIKWGKIFRRDDVRRVKLLEMPRQYSARGRKGKPRYFLEVDLGEDYGTQPLGTDMPEECAEFIAQELNYALYQDPDEITDSIDEQNGVPEINEQTKAKR